MAKGQRSRTPKTSKGVHGAGGKFKNLTDTQKVLMRKGMHATTKVLGTVPFRGAVSATPFDAKQAKLNRQLYPHLFSNYEG